MKKRRSATGSKRVRVRSKRLDQLDESKLALAIWLMAKQLVDEAEADKRPEPPRKEAA